MITGVFQGVDANPVGIFEEIEKKISSCHFLDFMSKTILKCITLTLASLKSEVKMFLKVSTRRYDVDK